MPMFIKGEDDREFELALIADPLADVQDGFGDAAAVTVTFRVATPDESWEETAPCLSPFEFQNLVEWLNAVADGGGNEAELELLQPELRFAVVKEGAERVTLRIGFHLADRPEEFEVDAPTDVKRVDLRVTKDRLRTAAEQLKHDLETLQGDDKDDLDGAEDLGMIDRIEPDPPLGAGEGVDNAGER